MLDSRQPYQYGGKIDEQTAATPTPTIPTAGTNRSASSNSAGASVGWGKNITVTNTLKSSNNGNNHNSHSGSDNNSPVPTSTSLPVSLGMDPIPSLTTSLTSMTISDPAFASAPPPFMEFFKSCWAPTEPATESLYDREFGEPDHRWKAVGSPQRRNSAPVVGGDPVPIGSQRQNAWQGWNMGGTNNNKYPPTSSQKLVNSQSYPHGFYDRSVPLDDYTSLDDNSSQEDLSVSHMPPHSLSPSRSHNARSPLFYGTTPVELAAESGYEVFQFDVDDSPGWEVGVDLRDPKIVPFSRTVAGSHNNNPSNNSNNNNRRLVPVGASFDMHPRTTPPGSNHWDDSLDNDIHSEEDDEYSTNYRETMDSILISGDRRHSLGGMLGGGSPLSDSPPSDYLGQEYDLSMDRKNIPMMGSKVTKVSDKLGSRRHSLDPGLILGQNRMDPLSRTTYYKVEFKAGRYCIFYPEAEQNYKLGDFVLVEADRGKDLGKIIGIGKEFQDPDAKVLYRLAAPSEISQLPVKMQDEQKALQLCQQKIRQKKLPMEVVEAEYQWDRRKLTYYFVADRRIDFRELVRELFKIYKTRIWMCSVEDGRIKKPSPLPK